MATIPPSRVSWKRGVEPEKNDLPDLSRAETLEKGHGRIEHRMIAVRTKLPQYLQEKWPDLKVICRIERRRETKTFCSQEVVYAITSLSPEEADASQLLQLARDHWHVENGLHHVLDITFQEDACRVRSGTAPEILSELRKAALTMIRNTGQKPRPAREIYAERKRSAIKLVMN